MKILVTGGAGFIGSHTCLELLDCGQDVLVVDNLSNSKRVVLDRIERLSGRRPAFVQEDIRNRGAISEILVKHEIEAVIHFAGLKAVEESVREPLNYYTNNVSGTLSLVGAMDEVGVKTIVFSSSATVYGNPERVPISEDSSVSAINPYGRTKLIIEEILGDLAISDNSWRVALLRYFNPAGAHESGLLGEDPGGIPGNLMPYISQVATGKLKELKIFGDDYPTPDGTGVRDYIHVVDLARGHIAALEWLVSSNGIHAFNLGGGKGKSVLEVVRAYESASGKKIPYRIVPRRRGDVAECFADTSLAEKVLGWKASKSIEEICRDAWNWQKINPEGYEE